MQDVLCLIMETTITWEEAWAMDPLMRRTIAYGVAVRKGNTVDWETGNIVQDE